MEYTDIKNRIYTYRITDNGYFIDVDNRPMYHQYEPFIPNHNLSYEENAIKQIQEIIENENASVEQANTIEKQIADLKDGISTNQGGVDELGNVVSDLASALDDLASTVSTLTEGK